MNLKKFEGGKITFPFIPSKFQGITFEFEGGKKTLVSYKVFIPDSMIPEFKSYYLNELENNKNNIFLPSILDIQQNYYNEIVLGRNLKKEIWNCPENNMDKNAKCTNSKIKYKVDEVNKCNVIIQNSFDFDDIYKFLGEMMEKFSQNTFPIIVIENYNGGGKTVYSLVLQKVLNYKSAKNRVVVSTKFNTKNEEILNNQIVYNIDTCKKERVYEDKVSFKEFDNTIITNFYLWFNTYKDINEPLKKYNHSHRKPTDIIVFTDGYSFSATSIFIKDLQETGNAIIVGYNGIPSERRKKEKFDASQSPSSVKNLTEEFPYDPDIIILSAYQITMRASFFATYSDNYQDKTKSSALGDYFLRIPREYIINPIDERSNIYGPYSEDRYNEFIKEAKRIFEKYKKKCNPKNKNLLLKNDSCVFNDDKYARGGFQCDERGIWTKKCVASYCIDDTYYFDNFKKKCIKDGCYLLSRNNTLLIIILVIIVVIIVAVIIYILFCK